MDRHTPHAEPHPPGQSDQLDPNFGGGYHGLRMVSGGGRAAYGLLRVMHERDLESVGGFDGVHGGTGRTRPALPPVETQPSSNAASGLFGRDFNARGPTYDGDGPVGQRTAGMLGDGEGRDREWRLS